MILNPINVQACSLVKYLHAPVSLSVIVLQFNFVTHNPIHFINEYSNIDENNINTNTCNKESFFDIIR